MQACKTRTQFKIASGEESNAAQQPNSSDGVGTESSKVAIGVAKTFELIWTPPIPVVHPSIITQFNVATSNSTSTTFAKLTNTITMIAASAKVTPAHTTTTNTSPTALPSPATHINTLTPPTTTTVTVTTTTTSMITHATQEAIRVSDSISQGACDECDVCGPRVLGVVAIAFTFKSSLLMSPPQVCMHIQLRWEPFFRAYFS